MRGSRACGGQRRGSWTPGRARAPEAELRGSLSEGDVRRVGADREYRGDLDPAPEPFGETLETGAFSTPTRRTDLRTGVFAVHRRNLRGAAGAGLVCWSLYRVREVIGIQPDPPNVSAPGLPASTTRQVSRAGRRRSSRATFGATGDSLRRIAEQLVGILGDEGRTDLFADNDGERDRHRAGSVRRHGGVDERALRRSIAPAEACSGSAKHLVGSEVVLAEDRSDGTREAPPAMSLDIDRYTRLTQEHGDNAAAAELAKNLARSVGSGSFARHWRTPSNGSAMALMFDPRGSESASSPRSRWSTES